MEKPPVLVFTYREADRKQVYMIHVSAISRCLFEQNGDVRSLHIHYSNGSEADKFTGEVAVTIFGLLNSALSTHGNEHMIVSELW